MEIREGKKVYDWKICKVKLILNMIHTVRYGVMVVLEVIFF